MMIPTSHLQTQTSPELQHQRFPMPTHSLCLLSYCPLPHPHPFPPRLMQCPLTSSLSSVTQLCATLCDPIGCSMPGLPVHHQLPEFIQTRVHCLWCHPTISSSVIPFSSHLQSFPGSGSFPMSQFFTSGGPSIGVSASTSVLPMNIQDWFPLGWTGWISFLSKGLKNLLQHHSSKASILWCSAFFIVQLSHRHITTGKTIALTRRTFAGQGMSLLFNMLSRLVIAFLPRSKHLLISWLQSPSAVILEPQNTKSYSLIVSFTDVSRLLLLICNSHLI